MKVYYCACGILLCLGQVIFVASWFVHRDTILRNISFQAVSVTKENSVAHSHNPFVRAIFPRILASMRTTWTIAKLFKAFCSYCWGFVIHVNDKVCIQIKDCYQQYWNKGMGYILLLICVFYIHNNDGGSCQWWDYVNNRLTMIHDLLLCHGWS